MTYYPVRGMEPEQDPAHRDSKRHRNGTGIGTAPHRIRYFLEDMFYISDKMEHE